MPTVQQRLIFKKGNRKAEHGARKNHKKNMESKKLKKKRPTSSKQDEHGKFGIPGYFEIPQGRSLNKAETDIDDEVTMAFWVPGACDLQEDEFDFFLNSTLILTRMTKFCKNL